MKFVKRKRLYGVLCEVNGKTRRVGDSPLATRKEAEWVASNLRRRKFKKVTNIRIFSDLL